MKYDQACAVCGGDDFTYHEVLWPELIDAWELESHEVDYINRQQGFTCSKCGNNLRSMALADAILKKYQYEGTLAEFVGSELAISLKVLEINEAGGLSKTLSRLPGHSLIEYPEYDMTKLPFERGLFDLVLHSDTLEHVVDPVAGLTECRKILNPTGVCIYTVPIVVGRLTRSRDGLKDSFHGKSEQIASDFLVRTEFGSDMWVTAMKAGFSSVRIHNFEYPSAIAIEASVK